MAMSSEQIRLLDAHWRAANYLTVGQVYLRDNPLLREPLTPAHVKPRLLDHWGTSPGERDEGGRSRRSATGSATWAFTSIRRVTRRTAIRPACRAAPARYGSWRPGRI